MQVKHHSRRKIIPEGAEVRRNGDLIRQTIEGKIIISANAVSGKLHRNGIKGQLKLPCEVIDVSTRGKVIFIKTCHLAQSRLPVDDDYQWIISTLGMSGWWYPVEITPEVADRPVYSSVPFATVRSHINIAKKYSRFSLDVIDSPFSTEEGNSLFYSDMRNFGNLYVTDYAGYKAKWNSIGVDLSYPGDDITVPIEQLRKRKNAKREIGAVLLDQSVLAGLGNIYRAEALYLAGIDPFRRVEDLTDKQLDHLINMASWVLQIAYDTHGVMAYPVDWLKNLTHLDLSNEIAHALPNPYLKGHLVYSSQMDPHGQVVRADKSAGRTMWWCPAVQA